MAWAAISLEAEEIIWSLLRTWPTMAAMLSRTILIACSMLVWSPVCTAIVVIKRYDDAETC